VEVKKTEDFVKALTTKELSALKDSYLTIIDENLSEEKLLNHFHYLNLTVEWLLSILNNLHIGFCIFSNKKYLAYNTIFKKITNLTYGKIKDSVIPSLAKEPGDRKVEKEITKLLEKEIENFTEDVELIKNKPGKRKTRFIAYPITIEGKSFGVGYLLNEQHHKLEDKDEMRLNQLVIQELYKGFKILNKMQGLDIAKIKSHSKENILNSLIDGQPDYGRYNLSDREFEVLLLIYKGFTNQQIADELFISKRTVDFHRANLLGKTNSRNTADLIRFAVENQLIKD
jgi:DNA-binding CsgD family transcriptional regulator